MNQQSGELIGRIGPYRALTRIGADRMGVVHRGTDPAGRDVAIRELPPGLAADEAGRRRLAEEIAVLRGVLSPHAADVLDGDAYADPPYVVTRYVPGRSLAATVAGEGPLRGGTLRRVALGLARALTAVHEAGAVHRDLRPGTVLMVGGRQGEPVVADFGLVPAPGAAGVGDRDYQAPEVVAGRVATAASDVYAWAATVVFAATGRPPAGAGAPPDGVPGPLRPVLEAALAPDPAARPAAGALVDAVAAADLGPPEEPVAPAAVRAGAGGAPAPAGPRPGRPSPTPAAPRVELGPAWSRLLAVLTVVLVSAVVIMVPAAGAAAAVAGALALRIWDSAAARGAASPGPVDVGRALLRTALTLPYAAAVAVALTVLLVAVATVDVRTPPLWACAWGTGAGVAALWAAPGIGAPRRQLERVFTRLAPEPGRIVLIGTVLGVLAFVAVVGAVSLTPSFAPMYGLQNTLVAALERLQNALP
ncbi:protein kinase domain-containing protein [Thermomonospora amylolytica]|uniref:protein kinase domain-containing protein n=1 Tax=Thermomonospora amylolytica TaxID=1411117 RepID=UPI000E6BF8FB|nr:serine/threonine-protein kinase [Thermomonospora amylolytica]